MQKTNWQKNIRVFLITSVLQWFLVSIGVWVLIWRQYMTWEQIGILTSFGLLVQLLLELPSGALADLWGRKNTVVFGRILGIIGFSILVFATDFWSFLIGNTLYLANWAFESGALSALLYDSLKENGKAEQYYQKTEADTFFWCTLGMAGASILGGFLYKYGTHLPYVACVIAAVGAFISSLYLEEPLIDSQKFSLKAYAKQNREGFLHIFRNVKIRAISAFSILITFVAYTGLWYLYEPRLAEGGFPASWMGILVAGTYLIRAIGTKLIPLAMKLGDKYIPYFLALSQMFGSALSFLGGRGGAIASVYARKMADGFRYPILGRLENEAIESQYRATSLSAISLLGNVLISGVGPLLGWAMATYTTRVTMGIFFFVGLFLVLPAAANLSRQIRLDS